MISIDVYAYMCVQCVCVCVCVFVWVSVIKGGAYNEDGCEGDLRGLDEGEDGEVAEETRGHGVTTTPWGGTRCTNRHILHTDMRRERYSVHC